MSEDTLIGAIDQGTSSSRFLVGLYFVIFSKKIKTCFILNVNSTLFVKIGIFGEKFRAHYISSSAN
jgi:hypothetical protein